jgi:hypothetical protein
MLCLGSSRKMMQEHLYQLEKPSACETRRLLHYELSLSKCLEIADSWYIEAMEINSWTTRYRGEGKELQIILKDFLSWMYLLYAHFG